MRKIVTFAAALILCLSLSVTAFASTVKSNQGGNYGGDPVSPKTGSSTVAVLLATACAAGSVGLVSYKKSKEE